MLLNNINNKILTSNLSSLGVYQDKYEKTRALSIDE